MANAKKRMALIAAVLIAGTAATVYTDHFITTKEYEMELTAAKTAALEQETALPETETAESVPLAAAALKPETDLAGEGSPTEAASGDASEEDTAPAQMAAAAPLGAGAQTPETETGQGTEEAGMAAVSGRSGLSASAVLEDGGLEPAEEYAAVSAEGGPDEEQGSSGAAAPGARLFSAEAETAVEAESLYSQYLRRLQDLDAQIQKMRNEQASPAAGAIKALAETELELWDKELNTIYSMIMERLDEESQKELAQAERDWMRERDAAAEKAAPVNGGGAIDSAEYTASLAGSTRDRAYRLLEEYGKYLDG